MLTVFSNLRYVERTMSRTNGKINRLDRKTRSVNLKTPIHTRALVVCAEQGLLIGEFVDAAVLAAVEAHEEKREQKMARLKARGIAV